MDQARVIPPWPGPAARGCSRGITLFELLVASSLGLFLLIAIGRINLSRFYHSKRIQSVAVFQAEAGLALATLAKRLEQADRIVLHSTGEDGPPAIPPSNGPANVLFRVPLGAAFDSANNYRWAQYRLVDLDQNGRPETIAFYDNLGRPDSDCVVDEKFSSVRKLTVTFKDVTPAPPGGEPASGRDTNLLELRLFLIDPETNRIEARYTEGVTFRAGTYSNVGVECPDDGRPCDTGSGLAPPGVSDPPSPC